MNLFLHHCCEQQLFFKKNLKLEHLFSSLPLLNRQSLQSSKWNPVFLDHSLKKLVDSSIPAIGTGANPPIRHQATDWWNKGDIKHHSATFDFSFGDAKSCRYIKPSNLLSVGMDKDLPTPKKTSRVKLRGNFQSWRGKNYMTPIQTMIPIFFRGKIPQKTGIKITKKLENTNLSPKKLEKQSPQK